MNAESEINRNEKLSMDDDDILKVEKDEMIKGKKMEEMNENDENLIEDLNLDDIMMKEEKSYYISVKK
jgi:hypothetical protein